MNGKDAETGEVQNGAKDKENNDTEVGDYQPHNIADTEAQGGFKRRSKRERAAAAVSKCVQEIIT